MPKRKRASKLKSVDEAAEALKCLGLADIELEKIEARTNGRILMIKSAAKQDITTVIADKRGLEADLEAYYMEHVGEIEADGRKSLLLVMGAMGRRKSTELKPYPAKRTWAAVAEDLRSLAAKFLNVKRTVNKEKLRAEASDEQLREFGLRLIEKQIWWYEIDRTKLNG